MFRNVRRRPGNSRFAPKLAVLVYGAAVIFVTAGSAQATLIGTGPEGGPVPAGTYPGTLLADLVSPFSYSTSACADPGCTTSLHGSTSGTIDSAVFREAGGTLDFYYQVSSAPSSPTAISEEIDTNFAGFTMTLGWRVDGETLPGGLFVNRGIVPLVENPGPAVQFGFGQEGFPISPGTQSVVLVISTDATNFTAGSAEVVGVGSQTVASFQPASATDVPEPASLLLLAGGLVAIALSKQRSHVKTSLSRLATRI